MFIGCLDKVKSSQLVALAQKNLIPNTLLSFQNPNGVYSHLLPGLAKLPSEYEWPEINQLGGFDFVKATYEHSAVFTKYQGKVLPKLYEDTAISLVSETNIDKDIVYLTEKTWTPVVAEHLLLLQCNPGAMDFLERIGFDLDYDGIPKYDNSDHGQIADICEMLSKQDIKELYSGNKHKRKFNRNHALDEKFWVKYHQEQLKNFGKPFV